ncbi:hypothetical protein UFOVP1437_13 [uncultured Caudovirales phage]|uniref:Uncharacterized protein n=1 Tax=uncultured Caudovirales phage TaxID=2100421 RepID=A0A6J5SED2_9CAUD|nr:hypothetical protein UFOVP1437_13 [uncultured Caudovirales phage]CAB5228157.1 hypothetical protein UFOVP1531_51 [uncultured Caudovirales phage]
MALDFSLINGGNQVPDFTSNVMKQLEQDKQREQQMAIAQQQIAAQGPNQIDFARDARAAQMDAVKLAREQQAMGLDVNQDAREERKTVGYENLNAKQIEKIGSDINLDWSKFGVDKDISYKDYSLREDMHNLTKDQMKTKLGYEIKWGESTDDREERKFGFEIDKWKKGEAQKQELKDNIAAARKQGTEAVYNTLIDNGMLKEAEIFTDINAKLSAADDARGSKEAQQAKEEAFLQLAPTVMKGEKLSTKDSIKLVDTLYGSEFTNKVLHAGNIEEVGTTAFLNSFGKQLGEIAGDPNMSATISSAITGKPIRLPKVPEDVKEKNDVINRTFATASEATDRGKMYDTVIKAAEGFQLAGIGKKAVQSGAADAAALVQLVSKAAGIPVKSLGDFDRAEAIFRGNAMALRNKLSQQTDKDGNVLPENARLMQRLDDINEFGADEFRALKAAEGIDVKLNRAKVLQNELNKNPDIDSYQLKKALYNAETEETANPKDQTAKFKRLQELRAKAGK